MRTPAALLALSLAAAGCSSLSVSSDYDHDVDFSTLRTFGWMPADPHDGFGGNTIVRDRVASAIERELASKGFARSDASADFLVGVHLSARDRVDVTTWPASGYGWGGTRHWGGWDSTRVDVNQWTEGSLFLDMVRPNSRNLLWRGVATAAVDSSSGSEEGVNKAVHKLLEEFPPKP